MSYQPRPQINRYALVQPAPPGPSVNLTVEVVDGVTYYVPPWEAAFLEGYAICGSVRQGCQVAGIGRSVYKSHYEYSPPFQKRCKDAKDDANDLIYEEAHRRAVYGVDRVIFYQGERVDTVKEYSDPLMAKILAAVDPRFRTSNIDVTTNGESINVKPQVFLPQIEDGNTIDGVTVDDIANNNKEAKDGEPETN